MKVGFLSLPAADYPESRDFYKNVLGLEVVREHSEAPNRFTDFDLAGVRLKVFEWTEPWHAGHYTSFMLEIDDLDGVLERVKSAGFEASSPEITDWQGRIASIRDPFGNILNLLDAGQLGIS